MQLPRVATLAPFALLLLAVVPDAGASSVDAAAVASRTHMSPITRVVELLRGLTTKIEEEAKVEEDLYDTFICWAKSIVSQKQKSNTAAQSRIDSLATYIDDLKAGRIELTTERVDLEREIAALTGDIELATQSREKETQDYEEAKAEMDKAVKALEAAIELLREATKDHEDGVLLATRGRAGEGFAARAREAATLFRALELGEKVLAKGDALFLRRLLTGEVPTKDWEQLNRKATFKQGYKARSAKIQLVLADLLKRFNANLVEATHKEEAALTMYTKLMDAKGAQKTAAAEALAEMAKENGARGMSLEDATTEKAALAEQVKNDEGYVADVGMAAEDKKAEWATRSKLRTDELAAISKAIEVLHSGDSRDLFKKSFASQGYLFLQVGTSRDSRARAQSTKGAAEMLRAVARQAHDSRLSALAAQLSRGHFDEVISAIDTMLETLKSEDGSDLAKKEACESDRAADTREAIKTSRTMDELSDEITALAAKIEELAAEIEEKEKRVAAIGQELQEAKEMRDKENAAYLAAKKEDEDAMQLVDSAKKVIEQFYAANGLSLEQQEHQQALQRHARQPFVSEAGGAPPPPPPTWEAPYGGKSTESMGISAILGLIYEDIRLDIAKADEQEKEALDLYSKTKTDLDNEEKELQTAISDLNTAKSTAMGDVENSKADRNTQKGELGTIMKKIRDAQPGCDFFTVNFSVRSKNRQTEVDGLEKAKAILSGASFGTALLQGPRPPGHKFLRRRLA